MYALLVQRRFNIEMNWQGISQPTVKDFRSGTYVHRIKVDEQAGFVITTSMRGGVIVADLHKDDILWSLPPVCHFYFRYPWDV